MTWLELVRKYFPNATEQECEYILWEKTGYPCFFDSEIGPEEHFGRQLETYRVACNIGYDVCACCGRIRHDVKILSCEDCSLRIKKRIEAEAAGIEK